MPDIILATAFDNPALPQLPIAGLTDDFGRANGPLGSTFEGKPWVRSTAGAVGVAPEIQVVSQRAAVVAGSGTTFVNYVAEAGVADWILDVDLAAVGSRAGGIIVRSQSSNTWLAIMLRQSSTNPGISLVESNNSSRVVVFDSDVVPVDGDHLRIIQEGNRVRVIRNGIQILDATSNTALGATLVGLHGDQNGVGMAYDNFALQPL